MGAPYFPWHSPVFLAHSGRYRVCFLQIGGILVCFVVRFLRFPVVFPQSIHVPTMLTSTQSPVCFIVRFLRFLVFFQCLHPASVFPQSIHVPTMLTSTQSPSVPTEHPCPNHLEVAQIWTSRRISFFKEPKLAYAQKSHACHVRQTLKQPKLPVKKKRTNLL